MKQFEMTERELGGNKFFIRPFPAFTAANISGELAATLTPLLASLVPAVSGKAGGDTKSIMDIDESDAVPMLAKGFESLSGDKMENLLHKLLTKHKNISVKLEGKSNAETLTDDIANEAFCGDVQDMYILAFEVIKVNFSGFFKRIGGQFGDVLSSLTKNPPTLESLENSTRSNSAI